MRPWRPQAGNPAGNGGVMRKRVLWSLGGLVAVGAIALGVWTTTCPCDRTPGFMLLGQVAPAPVADWRFANDVPLCQLQVSAYGLPHAINLNCMSAADGRLFLSCSVCDTKFWAKHVAPGSAARLRLNGTVYPVTLTRVTDDSTLDVAWRARVLKLQTWGTEGGVNAKPKPDAPRPPRWWSFEVRSRAS